jgi:hypothetical protein
VFRHYFTVDPERSYAFQPPALSITYSAAFSTLA